MEIDDLIISVRATNGLKGAGIFTVRDLAERMNGQAIENHGMLGKDGWREIALALAYELNKIDTDGLRGKARRLDAIVEAITERPNAKGQRGAACGASAAPTGCASNGDTE